MSPTARSSVTRRPPRGGLLSLAALSLVAAGCQEQRFSTGAQLDVIPPVVAIQKTSGDTMDVNNGLKFGVTVNDNLGIKTVSIALTGGHTARIDSVFTRAVTALTLPVNIGFPPNSSSGGVVYIRVTATDGNNNATVAQDSVVLTNINALIVLLQAPTPGAIAAPGLQILVQVYANQNNGVKRVGWNATTVPPAGDSVIVTPVVPPSIYPDSVTFASPLTIPAGMLSGTFLVTGFAEDSSGRRVTTPAVTVTIASVATDVEPPLVIFTVAQRVEVQDAITVRALDPGGIASLGWTATDLAGTPVAGGTIVTAGTFTDETRVFPLNLTFTTFPQTIVISSFATDVAGNTGQSRTDLLATAPFRVDTIDVVAGITKPLPAGGRVADAVYNKNLNEIYMTNIDLNRVEVFRIADTSFTAFAYVGARPWGIALWPGDTVNGSNADTVIVANSGGTNLSIVDVSLAARREVRRVRLPNFNVFSVQTAINPNTGGIQQDITEHLFADRPQYVATVCRGATCVPRGAGDVLAVYSTTPTPGQTVPFPGRGTMQWENLTSAAPESHFFWEHAAAGVKLGATNDTLRIEVIRGTTVTRLLDEACGATVAISELAFLDTTLVRNSGNFGRILIGESGLGAPPLVFARAMTYDGNSGMTPTCTRPNPISPPGPLAPYPLNLDNGVSPSFNVRDLITNAAAPVHSIAVNFNGLTNMIRADSIYIFDRALRLHGLLQIPGPNYGMDLNFNHKFDAGNGGTAPYGGTLNRDERLLFAARPDANIDVYDTYFYGIIQTIPLRDPVIGLLRVAQLPTLEQVLIGVTARGIVVARMPPISNTTYQAPRMVSPRP